MIVSDSGVDEEEGQGEDVFVESRCVPLILVKQGKGNLSLCWCIIGGKCCFEGFLDFGPILVCFRDMFVFKLGEPSLGKGFSSAFGHPIEENHGSCFIRKLVHVKSKVDLHGHEPSVGIFSFFAEFFKKGGFDVHHVIVIKEGIYMNGGGDTRK